VELPHSKVVEGFVKPSANRAVVDIQGNAIVTVAVDYESSPIDA
jgi:hypothetical protein